MPRLTPIPKREQVSGGSLIAFEAIIKSRGTINAPQSMHTYVPSPNVRPPSATRYNTAHISPIMIPNLRLLPPPEKWTATMYGQAIPRPR